MGRRRINKRLVSTILVTFVMAIIVVVIIGGSKLNWDWAGFNGKIKSGKTLWDWMQLLFIPVVLAVAGFWFNHRERVEAELRVEVEKEVELQRAENERKIATDNQRAAIFQAYIDKMSELLLHENLRNSAQEDEVRMIARVRTLTVLNQLDTKRKRNVLQFLYESELIWVEKPDTRKFKNVISLSDANLNVADLRYIDLSMADLNHANLKAAQLSKSTLWFTNLNRSDLTYANLTEANCREAIFIRASMEFINLTKATLLKADLRDADLTGADLSDAELTGADLSGAFLYDAIVTDEQLAKAKSLEGATMPDGSIHP